MTKQIDFLLFLNLLLALTTTGQIPTINGGVYDIETNQPVEFVSVYLMDTSNVIKSITTTDIQGRYSIENRGDKNPITYSALGYEKVHLPTDKSRDNSGIPDSIFLKVGTLKISEIKVTAKKIPVFKKSSDTTVYNVSSFSDSTEFSIEDLMNKLPGFTISKDGAIVVNGEAIDKVLIEGDDLFGRNYTIGTKNIRSKFINQVQVIDNHLSNPLLKNTGVKGTKVINLSLNEDVKNVTSGTLTTGTGYGHEIKKYAHANLFTLRKKSKTILLGNLNNVGFDSYQELEDTYDQSQNSILDADFNYIKSDLELDEQEITNTYQLPKKHTINGLSSLLSISQIWNISKFSTLKATGLLNTRKNNWHSSTNSEIFTTSGSLRFSEKEDLDWRNRMNQTSLNYEYIDPENGFGVRTFTGFKHSRIAQDRHINFSSNALDQNIMYNHEAKPWTALIAGEATKRLNSNQVVQLFMNYKKASTKDTTISINPNYHYLFENHSTDYILNQGLHNHQDNFNIVINYLLSFDSFFITLKSGYDKKRRLIRSQSYMQESINTNISEQKVFSQNHSPLSISLPYASFLLQKNLANIQISGGAKYQDLYFEMDSRDGKKISQLLPFLSVQSPIGEDMKITFSYREKSEPIDLSKFYSNEIITNYESFSTGLSNASIQYSKYIGFRYQYNEILKSLHLNAYFSKTISEQTIGINTRTTNFIFENFLFSENSSSLLSYGGALDKFLSKLSLRLALRYNINSLSSDILIDDILYGFISDYSNISIDCGTGFLGPLNFSSYIKKTVGSSTIKNDQSNLNSTTSEWHITSKITAESIKNLKLEFIWNHVTSTLNSNAPIVYNVFDTKIKYHFRGAKKATTISLDFVNLFNQNEIVSNYSDAQRNGSRRALTIPRFFQITADFSL